MSLKLLGSSCVISKGPPRAPSTGFQWGTNFEIGRLIVEHEQGGEVRAEYKKALLNELPEAPTEEFGRGFSKSNLKYMRQSYLACRG